MTVVERSSLGPVEILSVNGDLDVYTAPLLRQESLNAYKDGRAWFVVDLTGCTYLDSTGLGLIVGILKRARARDGNTAVAVSNFRILKIFQITGLVKVFAIRETRDEAVALLAEAAQREAPT